jgi:hypothetical protein
VLFKIGQNRGWRGIAIGVLLLVMLPALMNVSVAGSAWAAERDQTLPGAPATKRVALTKKAPKRVVATRKPYAKFDPGTHAALPGAANATVAVGARVRAGSSPVSVSKPARGTAPGKVQVRTADQRTATAAGVHGVLFSVRGSGGAGTVGVDVDPAAFRDAYGADYASRLRLVRLPECALTTPAKPECQAQTPVSAATLSAQVPVAATEATVLAATSTVSGPAGD